MTDDDATAKQLLDKLAKFCGYDSFEIHHNMICVFKSTRSNRYNADITFRNINGYIEMLTAVSYSSALKKLFDVFRQTNGTVEVFSPPIYSGNCQDDGVFLHLKKEDLAVWLFDCVLAGCEGADIL